MNKIRDKREELIIAITGLVNASEPVLQIKTLSLMLLGATCALHDIPNPTMFLKGFVIVGPLLWGGLYILNDVTDMVPDKLHPIKKNRPLPSGKASPKTFMIVAVILAGSAVILSLKVNSLFLACVILTIIKQMLYTLPPFRFNERFLVDILSGSVFNSTLRFLAGWFLFSKSFNFPLLLIISCEGLQVSGFLVNRLYSNYSIDLERMLGYKSTITQVHPKVFRAIIIFLAILSLVSFLLLALNSLFMVSPEHLGVLPLQSLSVFVILAVVAPLFLFSSLSKAESFSESDLKRYNDLPVFLVFLGSLFLAAIVKVYG